VPSIRQIFNIDGKVRYTGENLRGEVGTGVMRTAAILRRISPSGSGSIAREIAGAGRGERVGDADRADMRLPEPRPLRP
jgi:hypothetical protein